MYKTSIRLVFTYGPKELALNLDIEKPLPSFGKKKLFEGSVKQQKKKI